MSHFDTIKHYINNLDLKQRQFWDLILWFIILEVGLLTYFCISNESEYTIIPLSVVVVSLIIMWKNNRTALKEVKSMDNKKVDIKMKGDSD